MKMRFLVRSRRGVRALLPPARGGCATGFRRSRTLGETPLIVCAYVSWPGSPGQPGRHAVRSWVGRARTDPRSHSLRQCYGRQNATAQWETLTNRRRHGYYNAETVFSSVLVASEEGEGNMSSRHALYLGDLHADHCGARRPHRGMGWTRRDEASPGRCAASGEPQRYSPTTASFRACGDGRRDTTCTAARPRLWSRGYDGVGGSFRRHGYRRWSPLVLTQ